MAVDVYNSFACVEDVNVFYTSVRHATVFYNGSPLNCVEAAKKVQKTLNRAIDPYQWRYFHCVDLLAHLGCCFKQRQFSIVRELTSEMIFKQKPLVPERERIRQLVSKNFKVVDTNVEHLDQAEVICLGEQHSEENHKIHNAEIIDILSKKSDLILFEGNNNNPLMFKDLGKIQTEFVQYPLEIKGWDKRIGVERIKNDLFLNIRYGSNLFCRILRNTCTFFGLGNRLNNALQRRLDEVPERNLLMCEAIQANWQEGRKIYVIAGCGHLCSSEGSPLEGLVDLNPQNRAYENTLSYLRTKKFAILIPK